MSIAYRDRASRLASACPKEFDFQFFIYQKEGIYQHWFTPKRFSNWLRSIPDDTLWNVLICSLSFVAILLVALALKSSYIQVFEITYNVVYLVHVFGMGYHDLIRKGGIWWKVLGLLVDFASYIHYPAMLLTTHLQYTIKLACYYVRLHRPFRYLWALNDYNLKGSVLGTALKYCYIFLVLRLTFALLWVHIDEWQLKMDLTTETRRVMYLIMQPYEMEGMNTTQTTRFFRALYVVDKMFIPIGPAVAPANDYERVACLMVMITGCLVVAGAAVASLSLVISLYMRPEEAFRTRFRLIMKEMKGTKLPLELSDKVETFYRMYWHKQKAVSVTQLLPIFPPTLTTTIFTDIYFEAQQKFPSLGSWIAAKMFYPLLPFKQSRLLRDLSYQFLSEVAKVMTTIHYIPGDAIIRRSSRKSSIIYIAYGDVEMLTAEDNITPILRMTRGTLISPCGGCASGACAIAYVDIRAATFCTAHVVTAADLWRVVAKFGMANGQDFLILSAFDDHFERVKRHYLARVPEVVKYKSSILYFKQNLLALKEARDASGNLLLARDDVFLEIAGSYIMRNRRDSFLTEEADAICLRPTFPCILQPTSSLLMVWHCAVAFLICIVCFTHPYYLVFKRSVPLNFKFYDYVVTGVFILDLIVHLSTGANVEEGVPITFAQTSSQQMRSYWFVLDVLGTVPIFEFVHEHDFSGLNKILRLPKVFHVLKSMEDVCVYHSNVLRFCSYSLMLMYACYIIATLQQGFMCFQFGNCVVMNFTHAPHWINKSLDEETVENRMTFGLYWAVSMMTFCTHKTQTWGNQSWFNVLYTMFVLEMCVILHIFIEAMYSATIMVTTTLRQDYDSGIGNVKNFLIRNNVDPALRRRFITYLQLCWFTDKAYSMTYKKNSIFFDLPPHVYQDIVTKQRSKYLLSIPFMMYLRSEDLKNVSSRARLFYTSPNEILLNTGDIANEMYIIKRGICEIVNPDTRTVIKTITVKNHFGVLECLLRIPAFYTVRAMTHVQVFSISRKYVLKAFEIPKIKDAIEFAKLQPEYSLLQLRREAFLSYEPPPPPPNREFFRLPRKHEPDSAFLQPFKMLGFFSILRYIFPRFTIRPDGRYLMRYEWFRATCALAACMVFPSYSYLELQWPWLYGFTLVLDLLAYFDIFQRMLVSYFNEAGILVYHPSSTAAHYLKGAFIVDLMACMPLENLEGTRKETFASDKFRVTSTAQFLMLNRLLQLYRLPSAMNILYSYIERRDIILVIKALPLFVALINVVTCVMVFNSVDIFIPVDENADWLWQIVPHDDEGGSWLELFSGAFHFNMTENPWNLHLATYFWVVYETSTTGYGIFNPSNIDLILTLFCGMILGAIITTYFSVRIISIRSNVNQALSSYQEHMKDIRAYMQKENLHKTLERQVLSYYEHTWEKTGGIDYRHVLKLCDQITLRTDAILHIYGQTFAKCPILCHGDNSLIRIIGRAVHSVYFLENTVIIQKDDVISEMYFVDYGTVVDKDTDDEEATGIRLGRGSVFGNLESEATTRCPTALVTSSKVHLLQINTQTFQDIIADFDSVKMLLKKYRPNNENYIIGSYSESSRSLSMFKVNALYNPSILKASRKGLVKYLFVKDKIATIYLIVISMLCIYGDLYNAGFQNNSLWLIIALYVLDITFCLKIIMNYALPRLVRDEQLQVPLFSLRKKYSQHEFRSDVASCLPLEIFCLIDTETRWRTFALLRLNRMLRIVTVYNCLKRYHEKLSVNLVLSTVFTVFIWWTLFVHCTTCAWYYIGVMEDKREANSSWLHDGKGNSVCYSNLYICSVYFVLTTFTQNGVGDIVPRKQSEVIFVATLQIISTMVFMIYVGEFSNIFQIQSFRSFSYYSKYLELQEFLKNNRVSKNLVKVINKYSLHLWRESRGFQVPHFLQNAPPCFKIKVMSAVYLHHLAKHPAFSECEPAFLRQLAGCLRLYTYNEDMFVVKENEITDAMYLIHKGCLKEQAEDVEEGIKMYVAGEHFGMGLVRNTPYTYSYRALMKSQVLTLCLDDWEYLLKHFPKSKSAIYENRPEDSKPPDDSQRRSSKHSYSEPKLLDGSREKKRVQIFKEPTQIPTVSGIQKTSDVMMNRYFEQPPGPSPDYDETPIVLQPGLWPTDKRRKVSAESFVADSVKTNDQKSTLDASKVSTDENLDDTVKKKVKKLKSVSGFRLTSEDSKLARSISEYSGLPQHYQSKEKQSFLQRITKSALNLVRNRTAKTASQLFSEKASHSDDLALDKESKDTLLFEDDVKTFSEQQKKDVSLHSDTASTHEGGPNVQGKIRLVSASILSLKNEEDPVSLKADSVEEYLMLEHHSSTQKASKNEPPQPSRLSKRVTRVRYKDQVSRQSSVVSHTSTFSQRSASPQQLSIVDDTRPVTELTASQRNLRMLDSDVEERHPARDPSDHDATPPEASMDSMTSLKKKPKT